MSVSGRLDQHLFHVIEVQNNSAAYLEKRKNVIEVQDAIQSICKYDFLSMTSLFSCVYLFPTFSLSPLPLCSHAVSQPLQGPHEAAVQRTKGHQRENGMCSNLINSH